MVGLVRCVGERGRSRPAVERWGGMELLAAALYAPEGLPERRLERRLETLERTLRRAGVRRVVLPAAFPYAGRLRGLESVEPLALYREAADVLALGWLAGRGIPPERGRVALAGPRLCPELRQAAERLCRRVREVRVDAPGGEDYARALQREYGVPVVPPAAPADVTVAFGPTAQAAALRLYGGAPCLGGLRLTGEGLDLPPELEGPLLALLWERGSLRRERLRAARDTRGTQILRETLANGRQS